MLGLLACRPPLLPSALSHELLTHPSPLHHHHSQVGQSIAWDFNGTKLELTVESFVKLVPGGSHPNAGQVTVLLLSSAAQTLAGPDRSFALPM